MSDGTPRTRLRSLSLRDFRGIDALDLDLTGADGAPLDLAVFAGANGSGKTAVLEAVLMVLDLPELLPKDTAPRRQQIRFGTRELVLGARVEVRHGDAHGEGEAELRVALSTSDSGEGWYNRKGKQRDWPPGWAWKGPAIDPEVEYFSARREPEALGETPEVTGARSDAEAHRILELKRRLVSAYYRGLRASRERSPTLNGPFARLQRFWERFNGPGQALDVFPVSNDPGSGD